MTVKKIVMGYLHGIPEIRRKMLLKIFPGLAPSATPLPPPPSLPPSPSPPYKPPPLPPLPSLDQQLIDAIKRGDLNKVIDLIKAGANINTRDKINSWTPLHYAVSGNHFDIVRHLIIHGADVNAKDDYGRTPLHIAAGKGYLEIVKYLVEHGADINAKDSDGKTPIDYAKENGHNNVANYLRKAIEDKAKSRYQQPVKKGTPSYELIRDLTAVVSIAFSVGFLLYSIGMQALMFSIFSVILATTAIALKPRWFTVTWLIAVLLTMMVLAYPWTITLAIALFILYLIFLLTYWGTQNR